MTETEFFSLDESLLREREALLLDNGFMGITVSAPRQILTTKRDTLPLAIAASYSGERGWKVPMRDNSILVGMNLQSGKVHFSKAFVSERELISRWREEREPRGSLPSGLAIKTASLRLLDVRQKLNIDWISGKWALGVIYYDWPSNVVSLEIQGEKNFKSSPPLSVNPDPDPRGAGFLPSYQPTVQTPRPPKSGLTFTTEFKVVNSEPQLNVFGSFTLPIQDFHLPVKKKEHHFRDGSEKEVAAVIPMTFALIGLDWDEPVQFDWVVPVYSEKLTADRLGKGEFSIDALATDLRVELPAGEYACYIFMAGRIFGPNILKVPGV
ncbi:MAG: hypothetical protein GY799_27370 [Desulfobulbaceae bacterium]|nr:hypothetical protein [Desulfobulbaceae bacterium]